MGGEFIVSVVSGRRYSIAVVPSLGGHPHPIEAAVADEIVFVVDTGDPGKNLAQAARAIDHHESQSISD